MQQVPFELHMLRSLKGAGLSVLVALWLSRQPQNVRWLQRHTGYGFETVQDALEVLLEYQLVVRGSRYSWQIANTMQLPLTAEVLEDGGLSSMALTGRTSAPVADEKITPPCPPISKNEIEGIKNDFEKAEVSTEKERPIKRTSKNPKSDFENFEVPPSSSSRSINLDSSKDPLLDSRAELEKSEVADVLDEFEIREPARSEILKLDFVTAEMARYHLVTCENPGQAIYRIKKNWRVKESPLNSPLCLRQGWQTGLGSGYFFDADDDFEIQDAPEPLPEWQVDAFNLAINGLKDKMSHSQFMTWCTGLRLMAFADGQITLGAVNSNVIRFLAGFEDDLNLLFGDAFGQPVNIKIQIL